MKTIEDEFYEAIYQGREIEFNYNGHHYFESRHSDIEWYISCTETKETLNSYVKSKIEG